MADVVVDPEVNDPCELVKLGTKAYIFRDFNAAVAAYSRAIEVIATKHGDKHDTLGEIYLSYGKVLLDISRDENEALGDAVPREFSSDSEADEDNNENTAKEKKETEAAVKNGSGDGAESKTEQKNGQVENAEGADKEKESDDVLKEGDTPKAAEAGESAAEEKSDGDPTDLQLAWEVLELAKLIFEQRGDDGRKLLSETLVLLGDVSLESENFENAVADIKAGLEMQKKLYKPDSRTLAETYYKYGIALSTNNQIDEAIENYKASLEVLNIRLLALKEDEENQKDEISDIESLIPEIQEKIADMKSFKEEATSTIAAAVSKAVTENLSGVSSSSSSDKKISDINHLVKRKRKLDDLIEEAEESSAKKPST